ncbi:MAG: hypothetical protein AAGA03_17895, partial [Planctomycetota bacterium]
MTPQLTSRERKTRQYTDRRIAADPMPESKTIMSECKNAARPHAGKLDGPESAGLQVAERRHSKAQGANPGTGRQPPPQWPRRGRHDLAIIR